MNFRWLPFINCYEVICACISILNKFQMDIPSTLQIFGINTRAIITAEDGENLIS